jgi:hypothetical protein
MTHLTVEPVGVTQEHTPVGFAVAGEGSIVDKHRDHILKLYTELVNAYINDISDHIPDKNWGILLNIKSLMNYHCGRSVIVNVIFMGFQVGINVG